MTSWQVDIRRGSAEAHHARPLSDEPERSVWVHMVDAPALVLGSAQKVDLVDAPVARALGVEVARRRSGGGAVLLVPGEVAWLDVILPAGDPLWEDDVTRSGLWLGRMWQAALDELGLTRTRVHTGPLVVGPYGRLVCFAGIGPGEVTLDGRKVVGVSQRRRRNGARFQCAVYRDWDPVLLARLLRLDGAATAELRSVAVGSGSAPDQVVEAFLSHLPR